MPKFDPDHEELILKALEIISENDGTPMTRIAKEVGCDYQALLRRFHGTPNQTATGGTNARLNDTQNHTLIQWMRRQARHGFPMRKKHVVDAAYWILEMANPADAPPPKPLSHHWHARWHKAHLEIHSIMTTPLEATRKEAADVHTIKDWFELLRICLANYGIGVRDIWNIDETGFMVGMLKKCVVMVLREIKKCYTRNPNNKELITCVECISAAGEFIPSMIIIKGKKLHYRNFTNAAKEGHDKDTSWCNTKSGYIDSEKSLLWLNHFDRMSRRH
jgi:hypothetical protein